LGKRVAIVQSNYIPWKGYFDLIRTVDEFVLFDDMQYTRRDWRNRNRIKTADGTLWLTIPVAVKGCYNQTIAETQVSDPSWNQKHWKSLLHHYKRAAFFEEYRERLEELYLGCTESFLSTINHRFLQALCELLGIPTPLTWSSDYQLVEGKTERLLEICRQAGATEYWTGPAALDYLDQELFRAARIDVLVMDYSQYPEYHQLHPPFEHGVSVLDLLFNVGPEANQFMKSRANPKGLHGREHPSE
jgi:hypothetical protein